MKLNNAKLRRNLSTLQMGIVFVMGCMFMMLMDPDVASPVFILGAGVAIVLCMHLGWLKEQLQ